MRAQRACLRLFLDMDLATEVAVQVASGETPVAGDIETLIKSSEIGAQRFCEESMPLETKAFGDDSTRRLKQMEMIDFDAGELSLFQII